MGTWKDLTNQQFGSLIVERYLGNSKWQCRCMKCENEIIAMTNTLHNLNKLGREGCKHVRAIKPGDRYGSLTVVSAANDYIKPKTGAHEKQWLCKCQCGRDKIVLESNLKSFKTTSCGKCSHKISIPEKSIVFYLSKYFEDIQENYHTDFLGKKEIDIYIPSLKIGIEYDGAKWHKSVEKDLEKNRICKENGISLVRIREPKCISSEMFDHVIITPDPLTNGSHMTKPIKELISFLNDNYGIGITCDVNCLRDNADICKTILSTKEANSLKYKRPDIAVEWDYEKNFPLKPSDIAEHSGKKVWWICAKGHSYSSVVASRTGKDNCSCPICSNSGTSLYQNGKYIGNRSLLKEAPEIAKEFDEIKNKMSPQDVAVASERKVWWKCSVCGYEWQSKINNRTSSLHTGCPNCAKQTNKNWLTRRKKIQNSDANLLNEYPELCKEWDYEKNTINPQDVIRGSNIKVWWICSNGHSYQATVSHRTSSKPTNCPYCRYPNKDKKVAQYSLSGELIRIWSNAHDAANFLHKRTNAITRCCTGMRNKAYGYIWKYYDEIQE